MQKLNKLPKRQRIFEHLEPRNLLAGYVTADNTTNPGALTVIGDGSANIITITQTAPDTYKVAGTATKVNGSNSAQTFYAPNGIFVDMAGGNDLLTVKNLTVNGESGDIGLGILLGSGADVLVLTSVNVDFKTAIDGGQGNNAIVINKCNFYYDLGILTYGGTDAVTITNTHINGALAVDLGDGTANALTMVNVTVTEAVGGPDMSPLPPGFEVLEDALPDNECGAEIEGGSGVDVIVMNNVKIDCITQIDTAGGVDSVAIVNSRFGNQPVMYDLVQPLQFDSFASGLCIETGLGNDAVAIVTTTVYGFLQIDTSGEVDCPCDEQAFQLQRVEEPVKDGIDAVSLVKVNVFAAQQLEKWSAESVGPSLETVRQCCVQNGALFIYTGNQIDAVALAFVCTDGKATIRTTDLCDSSLDGADAVAIANSKFNQQSKCDWETGLCIVTGRGNDAVSIVKVNVVGKAKIETGDGTDKVAIAALVADKICADLGDGNYDALTIASSSARCAEFQGGGNTGDTLIWKHLNNHFDSENDSGFQYVL